MNVTTIAYKPLKRLKALKLFVHIYFCYMQNKKKKSEKLCGVVCFYFVTEIVFDHPLAKDQSHLSETCISDSWSDGLSSLPKITLVLCHFVNC